MTNASRREIRDARTAPAAGGSLGHACLFGTLALILFAPGVSADDDDELKWNNSLPSMTPYEFTSSQTTGERGKFAAAAHGSDIFVMAGRYPNAAGTISGDVPYYYTTENTFVKYSPGSGWTSMPTEIPSSNIGLNGAAAGVIGSSIYYVGGDDGSTTYATMFEYNIATEAWSDKLSMPTPRSYHAVAVSSDTLFAAGGLSSTFTFMDAFEAYTVSTGTWVTLPPMPFALLGPAAVEDSGVVYVLGGMEMTGPVASVAAYTTATASWTSLPSMPTSGGARYGLMAGFVGDQYLYAVGGFTSTGSATGLIQQFEPAASSWATYTLFDMPTARGYAGLGVIESNLYVVGGLSADNDAATIYDVLESFNAPVPSPTPMPTQAPTLTPMPTPTLMASVSSALAAATASTAIFVGALAITTSAALLHI